MRWPLRAILAALLGCVLAIILALLAVGSANSSPKPLNTPLFTYGSL